MVPATETAPAPIRLGTVAKTLDDSSRGSGKSAAAFRTISEVAEHLEVPQHVLRFWETKFNQVRPLKRGGGRRYYRPEDVDLLRIIRGLLYDDGYTIKGVQKLLREGTHKTGGVRVAPPAAVKPAKPRRDTALTSADRRELKSIQSELKGLKELLERNSR